MALMFLSHSSANELEAVALGRWLASNGWDDVFLDIDPDRGLAAGERWQDALRRAADRCEAVLFLISPEWARSKWCLAEFLLAKNLHKLIFGLVVKPTPLDDLPREMTVEWQLCRLDLPGATEIVSVQHGGQTVEVSFSADGLRRLRSGLQRAGLGADYFPWPPPEDPTRSPYRGLEPLEACDAAVFFGRDVEILRGIDTLRGMRNSGDQHLFVILGGSGAGKSSFLRAGVLPRLARDDRHFFALPVIRPETEPLYGPRGLACSIVSAIKSLAMPPANLGDVKARLREGLSGLAPLLQAIQKAARDRLITSDESAPPTPTLVFPLDQAEELFSPAATQEARDFLQLLGDLLRGNAMPAIVAITIRSDRYEPLQTAPQVGEIKSVIFDDLKPMRPDRFREVILGPAARTPVRGGRPLQVQPELVDRLVADCSEGGETLPLLSLALARLYRDYGEDGDLRLDEHTALGGIANVVKVEIESTLPSDATARTAALALLRASFIPWLVTINPDSDQPMRRTARRADLPASCGPLIDQLVEKRLLLADRRGGEAVVEVAHESLLRNWDVLTKWIEEERRNLAIRNDIDQCSARWHANARSVEHLDHRGQRLHEAEQLVARADYASSLGENGLEYVAACRERENQELAQERLRLERETAQAQESERKQRKLARLALAVAAVAAVVGVVTVVQWRKADRLSEVMALADETSRISERRGALRSDLNPADETAYRALGAFRAAGKEIESSTLIALHSFLAESGHLRKVARFGAFGPTSALAYAPDGRLAVGGDDGLVRLFNPDDFSEVAQFSCGTEGESAWSLVFNRDGKRLVAGYANGNDESAGRRNVCVFDTQSGAMLRHWSQPEGSPGGSVSSVAYGNAADASQDFVAFGSSDHMLSVGTIATGKLREYPHTERVIAVAVDSKGSHVATGDDKGVVRLWNAADSSIKAIELNRHTLIVENLVFTPDDSMLLSASDDGYVNVWNVDGRCLAQRAFQPSWLFALTINGEGSMFAAGGGDARLRLFNLTHKDCPADKTQVPELEPVADGVLSGHGDYILAAAFDANGGGLASASIDGSVRIWYGNTGTLSLAELRRKPTAEVTALAISPDGSSIVAGTQDGQIEVWDPPARGAAPDYRDALRSWSAYPTAVNAFAFVERNGRPVLVTATSGGALRQWDISDGSEVAPPLAGDPGDVRALATSADGSLLAAGSVNGTIHVWNLSGNGQPRSFERKAVEGEAPDDLVALSFSGDGKYLAANEVASLRVIPLDKPENSFVLQGHRDPVTGIIRTPVGERSLMSVARDGNLVTWTEAALASGQRDMPDSNERRRQFALRMQSRDGQQLLSAASSADGRWVVTGGENAQVQLWDAREGVLIGSEFRGLADAAVNRIAMAPDGSYFVSSNGTNLLLWPGPDRWAELTCAKLSWNLNPEQWKEMSPRFDYMKQCPDLPEAPGKGSE